MTADADDRDEYKITVYRDHPAWDEHEKWFMLPHALLCELFVASYVRRGYGRTTEASKTVQAIRGYHPGCVLVY